MAKRILVVDDDQQTLSAFVKLLRISGYYVRGADGYQYAIEAVEREDFDLLLSDIGLWDGDGCDLLQELKRKHRIEGIAVTGYNQPEDVQRCLDAGFITHVSKPVLFPALLKSIAEAFYQSSRSPSVYRFAESAPRL
jgi:CheY-like chemotaxis protein